MSSTIKKLRVYCGNHLAPIPFVGALVFLILFPLFMGGGEVYCLNGALSYCFVLYALWGLAAFLQGRGFETFRWSNWMLLPLLPIVCGCLQMLPWSPVTRLLSPHAATAWKTVADLCGLSVPFSLSLNPEKTLFFLQLYALAFLYLVLLINHCSTRQRVVLLALTIIGSALVNALIAYYQSSGGALFYWQSETIRMCFHGTYLNRNHFGCFMGMATILSIPLCILGIYSRTRIPKDRRIAPPYNLLIFCLFPLLFVFLLIFCALLASLSRGASLATAIMLVWSLFTWLRFARRHMAYHRYWSHIAISVLLLVGALLIALPDIANRLSERFNQLLVYDSVSMIDRVQLWGLSMGLVKDHWLTGVGLGAYGDCIPRYQKDLFTNALAGFAHNDWLEIITEIGVPAALLFIGLCLTLYFTAHRRLRFQKDTVLRLTGLGAWGGIGVALLHELTDYNLRAPGNTMIFIALCTVVLLCSGLCKMGTAGQKASSHNFSPSSNSRLYLLISIFCILIMLPVTARQFKGGLSYKRLCDAEDHLSLDLLRAADCKQMVALANASLARLPHTTSIFQQRASARTLLAMLAFQEGNAEEEQRQLELGDKDIRRAAATNPFNGDIQLQYAKFRQLYPAQYSTEETLRQFDHAAACHPVIINTLHATGNAYYQAYSAAKFSCETQEEAEKYRDKALEYYATIVRLSPSAAAPLYETVWRMKPDIAFLKNFAPQEFSSQVALFDFLMGRQCYPDALETLEQVQTMNEARKDQPQMPGSSTMSYEEAQIFIMNNRIALASATGDWETRNALVADYTAALKKRKGRAEFVHDAAACVQRADDAALGGKHEDMLAALLPITYIEEAVDADTLQKAMALVRKYRRADFRELIFPKHYFIEAALAIQIAEQKGNGTPQLTQWITNLMDLETWCDDHKNYSWLQRHLIPYYIGRALLLNGNRDDALKAFRRGLELSPSNLYIWRRIKALSPDEPLSNPTLKLAESLNCLQTSFTPALMLYGVTCKPTTVTALHDPIAMTHVWLCRGDITRDLVATASFFNNGYCLFSLSNNFVQAAQSMVTWKVGELHSMTRSFQPALESLKKMNNFSNDTVFVEFAISPAYRQRHGTKLPDAVPRTIIPLFSFNVP